MQLQARALKLIIENSIKMYFKAKLPLEHNARLRGGDSLSLLEHIVMTVIITHVITFKTAINS